MFDLTGSLLLQMNYPARDTAPKTTEKRTDASLAAATEPAVNAPCGDTLKRVVALDAQAQDVVDFCGDTIEIAAD
jgi:hypothetical protein